jgi:hypothetical protein
MGRSPYRIASHNAHSIGDSQHVVPNRAINGRKPPLGELDVGVLPTDVVSPVRPNQPSSQSGLIVCKARVMGNKCSARADGLDRKGEQGIGGGIVKMMQYPIGHDQVICAGVLKLGRGHRIAEKPGPVTEPLLSRANVVRVQVDAEIIHSGQHRQHISWTTTQVENSIPRLGTEKLPHVNLAAIAPDGTLKPLVDPWNTEGTMPPTSRIICLSSR